MQNNDTVSATTTTSAPKKLKIKASGSKVKATPKAAKTAGKGKAKDAPVKGGINIGRKTGKRVMAYQDWTFEVNDKMDRRFTNEQLAADWRAEFPESRAVKNGRITGEMVAAVRALYNAGTNGHGTPGETHQSKPYIVVAGKRVKSEPVRKAVAVKAVAPKTAATKVAKVKTAAPKAAPVADADADVSKAS